MSCGILINQQSWNDWQSDSIYEQSSFNSIFLWLRLHKTFLISGNLISGSTALSWNYLFYKGILYNAFFFFWKKQNTLFGIMYLVFICIYLFVFTMLRDWD